uniref:Uncharacterized protein n=1 Tax=Kalanchoe fedtschenkoi TaxID=63787 RepID=A0A7N0USI3_KALFE
MPREASFPCLLGWFTRAQASTGRNSRGQRRIRSRFYGPTPFESGWPTPPRTVMFDWAYTHSLTYAVPPQLTLALGLLLFLT